MKTKLFIAALSVFMYLLLLVGFTVADSEHFIPQALASLGLTNSSETATLTSAQVYASVSETRIYGNFMDPVPEPKRPTFMDPVPEPKRPTFMDPVPEPKRPTFMDPVPEPKRPTLMPE